jgi:putrescine aminotransferase
MSTDTATLQRLDAAHHLHPFNDNAALAKKGTRILTRGEGVYVWDSKATSCSTPSPACGA